MKLQILVHKKGLKGSAKYGKVFIQEDLTTMRFKLLRFTKDLECVKTVTTREGKIVCYLKNGGGRKSSLNPQMTFLSWV